MLAHAREAAHTHTEEWKFPKWTMEMSIVLHSLNGIPFMQVDISMEIY